MYIEMVIMERYESRVDGNSERLNVKRRTLSATIKLFARRDNRL